MLILTAYVISYLLIILGLWGTIIRRDNLIITLVCLEMALLGVALQFSVSGLIIDDLTGQLVFFLLLTLAGVESALGLALIISYYRLRTSVRFSPLITIKG